MATGEEPVSVVRVLLVLGIVGCVVGLKAIHWRRVFWRTPPLGA